MNHNEITMLELFSGIGGFTKGFERAGFKIKKHYFSEIDKHAIANYKYNFPNAEHIGSVTDVRGSDLERPDIITFGSPCQDFSLAGKQLGLEGNRSVLLLEAIRLITECKPSVFIWENVKGVFSSNNGADFWAVLAAFANIGGYRLEWQLLNTSWFLPQNRERIYLVGHLAGRSECGVFPITENDFTSHEERQKICENSLTLLAGYYKSGNGGSFIKQINDKKNFGGVSTKQQDRVYGSDGIMCCLSSSRTETKVNVSIVSKPHGHFKGSESSEISPTLKSSSFEHNNHVHIKPVLTPNRAEKRQNGRRFKEDGEPAFTLSCQDQHGVMFGTQIRRLTEIECERLQGFEDDHTKYGNYNGTIKETPKAQRYKMCGNAVTVDVVEAIAKKLKIT